MVSRDARSPNTTSPYRIVEGENFEKCLERLSTRERIKSYNFGKAKSRSSYKLQALPLFMETVGSRMSLNMINGHALKANGYAKADLRANQTSSFEQRANTTMKKTRSTCNLKHVAYGADITSIINRAFGADNTTLRSHLNRAFTLFA